MFITCRGYAHTTSTVPFGFPVSAACAWSLLKSCNNVDKPRPPPNAIIFFLSTTIEDGSGGASCGVALLSALREKKKDGRLLHVPTVPSFLEKTFIWGENASWQGSSTARIVVMASMPATFAVMVETQAKTAVALRGKIVLGKKRAVI